MNSNVVLFQDKVKAKWLIAGKQLLLTASDQLMKYIKWLEAQSEKI